MLRTITTGRIPSPLRLELPAVHTVPRSLAYPSEEGCTIGWETGLPSGGECTMGPALPVRKVHGDHVTVELDSMDEPAACVIRRGLPPRKGAYPHTEVPAHE